MKKEDEKTKKEENKYLFYTQYYLTAGVYHVVNVVNSILNYSATYSSGVKEYLEEKVLLQKIFCFNRLLLSDFLLVKAGL